MSGDGTLLAFERIAEDLRQQIRDHALAPGAALPSQSQLMKQYGASSLTVQKAMGLLRDEGWAVSRPGKGTFVSSRSDFGHAYETITTDLERLVRQGHLTPGAKIPSRQQLADQYEAPVTVVDAALDRLVDDHWLRRDENTADVHVQHADDPAMANRLAHAALTRKIDDGTLAEGTELTAETTAGLLGTDVRTAQQALNLLIMEHKAARVRRGIPTAHGGMRVEEVTVIGPGPGQGAAGTLEVFTGPSPEEMQARVRMDVLADALEDALGQIQELRERLDRLEDKHTRD
ncbi:GntR family transcriptional regulator [Streptomyces sp. NPDC001315]|uniref:GntR family transcriptional regulator n=1 Tax=Streptomyces sp. NPDC001315 TaxID=3364562 RepID=UPI0036BE700F